MCDLFEWKQICAGFYCLFKSVSLLNIQLSRKEGYGYDPFNRYEPATFLRLSKNQEICHCLFAFNDLSLELVFSFVDTDGIVDLHSLSFLFIIIQNLHTFLWNWRQNLQNLLDNSNVPILIGALSNQIQCCDMDDFLGLCLCLKPLSTIFQLYRGDIRNLINYHNMTTRPLMPFQWCYTCTQISNVHVNPLI